jgi:hypothetical protein
MLEDARRRMEATRTRPRRRRAQDRAALYTAAAKGAYQGVKTSAGSAYVGLITPEPFAEVSNKDLLRQRTFATIAAARLPSCSEYLFV